MWYLTVILFINGLWVSGESMDGWSAVPYYTYEECLEKRQFAQAWTDELLRKEVDTYPKRFTCLSEEEYALWVAMNKYYND